MRQLLERDFLGAAHRAAMMHKRKKHHPHTTVCFTRQSFLLALKFLLTAGRTDAGLDVSSERGRLVIGEMILRCSDLIQDEDSVDYVPDNKLLERPTRFAMEIHARGVLSKNLVFDRTVVRNYLLFGPLLADGLRRVDETLPDAIQARFFAALGSQLDRVRQVGLAVAFMLESRTAQRLDSDPRCLDLKASQEGLVWEAPEVEALFNVIATSLDSAAGYLLKPPSESFIWDYSAFERRPLVIHNQRIHVVDRNCVLGLSGPWLLKTFRLMVDGNEWNQFCNGFGYAFEDLVYEHLTKCLNGREYHIRRITGSSKKPDFGIRNGPAEIVIEATGALGLDSSALGMNPQSYVDQIARLEAKCEQLAKYLSGSEYTPDDSVKRIFPTIVTYADGGTSYGASEILRPVFLDHLLRYASPERAAIVKPLTVMAIDDLQQLLYLAHNGVCLRDIFDAYMTEDPIGRMCITNAIQRRNYRIPHTPPYFQISLEGAGEFAMECLRRTANT
jgi:hypothetical protein